MCLPNLVAITTCPGAPRALAEEAPRIAPAAVDVGGVEQRDAGVERSVDHAPVAARSMRPPKLLQPTPTTETDSPEVPRFW